MKDNQASKKYLDATKPENIPVSHTSKPSIVSNSSAHRDPMTLDSDESNIQSAQHKKIEPLRDEPKDDHEDNQEKDNDEDPKLKVNLAETPKLNEGENSEPQERQNNTNESIKSTTDVKDDTDNKDIDSSEDKNINVGSETNKDDAIVNGPHEFSERSKEIQDLIDKKTYNLPIKKAHSKKITILIIGVVLIMLAIGVIVFIINK